MNIVEPIVWQKLALRFRNVSIKCGEDDDGYAVCLKAKYFMEYMSIQTDDNPLYVFEGNLEDDGRNELLADYSVPQYFSDDLFSLVDEARRPPYRWFLIGPERSGTCIHVDPLGTSAWNTLLVGRKRWVMFPPRTAKAIVIGKRHFKSGGDDEPYGWFRDILPHVLLEVEGAIEFVQYPGETVFIASGWWHAVLNMDDTIAVTQNYVSSVNFDKAWMITRKGRRRMALRWLQSLRTARPELHACALSLNEDVGFIMPDSANTSESEDTEDSEDSQTTLPAVRINIQGRNTDSDAIVPPSAKRART